MFGKLSLVDSDLTLKLRADRKGYIILLKVVRNMVGIDGSNRVIVEIRDGILLKSVWKFGSVRGRHYRRNRQARRKSSRRKSETNKAK